MQNLRSQIKDCIYRFTLELGQGFEARQLPTLEYRQLVDALLADDPEYGLDAMVGIGPRAISLFLRAVLADNDDEVYHFKGLSRAYVDRDQGIEDAINAAFEVAWNRHTDELNDCRAEGRMTHTMYARPDMFGVNKALDKVVNVSGDEA